jgi:hypothetical protein
MPNKRFQETQDAGELTRRRLNMLKKPPMGAREAVRIICEIHSYADDRGVVRIGSTRRRISPRSTATSHPAERCARLG